MTVADGVALLHDAITSGGWVGTHCYFLRRLVAASFHNHL